MSQHDIDQQQRNQELRTREAFSAIDQQRKRWRDMDVRAKAQAARDAHITKLRGMFAGTGH
jgi:hypothetical protein